MKNKLKLIVPFLAGCAMLNACSTASPTAYTGLSSTALLQPSRHDKGGRVPLSYRRENVDWRQYKKIIVEPVIVYDGADNQFVNVKEEDRQALADYMRDAFTEELGKRFTITDTPAPDALRLQLTLTGAKLTSPVIGTLSHFDMAGGVYNAVQAGRGREGSMTGSVSYAAEVFESENDTLLLAFVAKQYPAAMNVGATFSSLSASRVGIDNAARDLGDRLN
ncbi:DUF3313 domain-containing protein [Martelella mangrovi]|uniref:DUF3313 domain-containing protein n=1 Tax=Martelella mangrovi TaxID=1397477 RepID=A0ABV2ICN2_9HYPH